MTILESRLSIAFIGQFSTIQHSEGNIKKVKLLVLNMEEKEALKLFGEVFKHPETLDCRFNFLHSFYMIKAIEEIAKLFPGKININKLKALVWVHDIGKIRGNENHAQESISLIEQKFKLNKIEKDCILNHGSSGKPTTLEGKIFRLADGLSLFYPEIVHFRFYAESKEGLSFDEIKQRIGIMYGKYLIDYSDYPKVVKLLKIKFSQIS